MLIERYRYYHHRSFKKADLALKKLHRWKNPYTIARKAGEVYGETPLLTMEKICKAVNLTKDDCFVEMGCGRGRNLLFVHHFFGCHVIGYEKIEEFCKLPIIVHGDMFDADFSNATVVYLYGTCLTDEEVERLTFPPHVTVVTVSYPLPGYTHTSFEGAFPWGKTDIFINYSL